MCDQGLQTQCETTQVREEGMGAMLFGYTKLYGSKDGGQAEYLRVPQAQYTHIKVPDGPPDERFVYLSDVLPTAWQAVEYAEIPEGGSVTILGLGPIGDMAARVAMHRGYRVIGVDLVPERLERARGRGANRRHGKRHADRPPGSAPEVIHTPHRLQPSLYSIYYCATKSAGGSRSPAQRGPSDTFSVA